MAPTVQILDITPGSDGDGRKWPKHHYTRNDEYFKERIATDKWIKDLPGGAKPDVIYRLNKLPNGYAGFERQRPDSKHIDRYIYGHPNGQFRSLNEFYPHFKHLMDHGGPAGCECKQCKANGKKRGNGKVAESGNDSDASGRPQRSQYFAEPPKEPQGDDIPNPNLISPFTSKHRERLSTSESARPERKLVDGEGTPDVYETLIRKLKEAGPEDIMDTPIEEHMSPDWRTNSAMCRSLLDEWQKLPRYVPRTGEIVLFVRNLDDGEMIAWDQVSETFRCMNRRSKEWLGRLKWEAGVVTQMPKEPIADEDLVTDAAKEQGVNYSGFRIEPLSEPGNERKPYTKQHKHVPLHAIRPFTYWKMCLNGVPKEEWHPTIKHALTVSSSFCTIGRFRFKGIWPNATVFCRGVYLGSELIMVGDTISLVPRKIEQKVDTVTDVMVVTAIRLRFVNLNMQESDISTGLPYQTCLHVSGRVLTLDSRRSFDGVGKVPIDPKSTILPDGISSYGQWYHYLDPTDASARTELPYTRILGRCFEQTATKVWFGSQPEMPPPSSFQAVNKKPMIMKDDDNELSRGLQGVIGAREYSQKHDKRIKLQEGKIWFWADTRVEQLNLYEVNGRFVGMKNEDRTKGEMANWRRALKAIDGKKGALEEYQAARKKQQAEKKAAASTAYGMVASSMQAGIESGTEVEQMEDDDAMDLDERVESGSNEMEDEEDDEVEVFEEDTQRTVTPKKIEPISLDSDDDVDDDELVTNQLAGELAKKIRPNESKMR